MRRNLPIAVLIVVVFGWLVYLGDYLSLRYRFPNHREQFATLQVTTYYAVPMKDRKTDYMFNPPASQTCVNSLFPHFGDSPCWYLSRHTRQEINVGGAQPGP
jgi:hypothetical protein